MRPSGYTSPVFGRPGSFPPTTMPAVYPAIGGADFCHTIASPYGSVSPDTGPHGRSPGVNTHLCAHERRVYAFGLRWIEDFALCCRLVPPTPRIVDPACGDSVLVPRIGVRGRLARAFALPCRSWAASFPGSVAGYPVAIPLYRCRSLRSLSPLARVSVALQPASIPGDGIFDRLGLGLDEL